MKEAFGSEGKRSTVGSRGLILDYMTISRSLFSLEAEAMKRDPTEGKARADDIRSYHG